MIQIQKEGTQLAVINLSGRVQMDPAYNDPFYAFDELTKDFQTPHIFLDFHAEVTSEKIAMGYHCEGRATAVVGTHTHVQTADETVLAGGTAYITDVGMCGPRNSVLGMDRDIILRRFRTGLPEKFEVANEPGVISGVAINVRTDTGRATSIERIQIRD
jgi:metallophosphoesterase (TIGR00282 family)